MGEGPRTAWSNGRVLIHRAASVKTTGALRSLLLANDERRGARLSRKPPTAIRKASPRPENKTREPFDAARVMIFWNAPGARRHFTVT
jgi:hypothetical protein